MYCFEASDAYGGKLRPKGNFSSKNYLGRGDRSSKIKNHPHHVSG
ncbi:MULTISPECIES: hypothetical protein [unclassified Nostoc]|nr:MULTISPECIES: hypothetical protein [unclassified Nostoc]